MFTFPSNFKRLAALLPSLAICCIFAIASQAHAQTANERHLLYVAEPGIRDDLQYGGHGVLVFDIDDGHRFVRRIPLGGLDDKGKPMNVKGICACAATGRLYVSSLKTLCCLDLETDKVLWEKPYDVGCDRMSIVPDGKTIYVPSLEGPFWRVVDANSGDVLAKIETNSGSHNTIAGPDGKWAYLAGLKSRILTVADTQTRAAARTVGPFDDVIRPFTIDGDQKFVFVNVNGLLGFEVGDLATGKMIHRVEVTGFAKGPTKRHGCPSHGIGLTPDGKDLWLCDSFNRRLHVFDATVMPPVQTASIELRDEPGWVTFSIDGRYAFPSSGEIIDVKSRKVIGALKDEQGRDVESEKLLEIDFAGSKPVRAGDQFGISRSTAAQKG
jgi:DNA-binding beta-propeller fold protein YncE